MKNQKDFAELLKEVRNSFEYRLESLTQTFSDELWHAMSASGLTQAQLARRAGVNRQFLTRVFRGKPNLTLKTLQKLAEAVGYRLNLHLAPSELDCEWIHVIKSDSHESISGTTKNALVGTPTVVEVANEELALAA